MCHTKEMPTFLLNIPKLIEKWTISLHRIYMKHFLQLKFILMKH